MDNPTKDLAQNVASGHDAMASERLINEIRILNHNFKVANSKRYALIRGLITGIGTAIGATIVAGVLITMLARVIDSVDDVPILNTLIESINLKELINNNGKN